MITFIIESQKVSQNVWRMNKLNQIRLEWWMLVSWILILIGWRSRSGLLRCNGAEWDCEAWWQSGSKVILLLKKGVII